MERLSGSCMGRYMVHSSMLGTLVDKPAYGLLGCPLPVQRDMSDPPQSGSLSKCMFCCSCKGRMKCLSLVVATLLVIGSTCG